MNRTILRRACGSVSAVLLGGLVALSVPPGPAIAASGKVITDMLDGTRDEAQTVAIQPDGKIVVAGDAGGYLALARYRPDGSLDPGFGGTGRVTTPGPLPGDTEVMAVAVLPDGRILAAGHRYHVGSLTLPESGDIVLVRYQPDGSLDPTFGDGGMVITDRTAVDLVGDMAIQPDGRIVVAGSARPARNDFVVIRYHADGSLDTGFGTGGAVTTDFFGQYDWATAVSIQADGRIVVGGFVDQQFDNGLRYQFGLARYRADGSLDDSFGTGGRVVTDFANTSSMVEELVIQRDGRILVTGAVLNRPGMPGGYSDFALARYHVDGSLDGGFGVGGKVRTDFENAQDRGMWVAVRADGRIVVAGFAHETRFGLAGYRPDGALDPGFGTGGKVTTDFGGMDRGNGAALASDGRLVVAGQTWGDTGADFAVARYAANGALDTSFG
jgi:uncharacterized delta-60 repeat protein